ncbi:unnamed protein product [Parascedosporium putredinis]|uniref:Uncharacterized protein n=1 Tax=Parascedosporium putredinis TaxID=1442378 RepID=A0A9P1GZA2_9PEZI|nr:unnamed protein product [Parascedosporium putredinis]CAI7990867.1 unnamed protein product [Parascedosporium putredinis]
MHVRLADEAITLQRLYCLVTVQPPTHPVPNKIHTEMHRFLSENTHFARLLSENGIVFAGPSPETIMQFGLKHRARELAILADVPVIPGSSIITSLQEAAMEATRLGYPIMVKATAGGGGMGLRVCHSPDELENAVQLVQSRGEALFKDAGFFLEKYVQHGSPFVLQHPDLRHKLQVASTSLARLVKYKSAGTVEFLVDDKTGNFYFLEMNTRLQVEHGVTELCYGVDLVALMLKQATAEFHGRPGLTQAEMAVEAQPIPQRHAMEVRVYAENPADNYNPLIAKIMVYGNDRADALEAMRETLESTILQGPICNLDFLIAIIKSNDVVSGNTTTGILDHFNYQFCGLEFKDGGLYTTVQDFPGRPHRESGVPVSGPMDALSFRIANLIAGNSETTEGFEISCTGPWIKFHDSAVIVLSGAPFEFSINGKTASMWTRHVLSAGSEIRIGACSGRGCRAYLAILGGLPNVGSYLGSKSTTPSLKWEATSSESNASLIKWGIEQPMAGNSVLYERIEDLPRALPSQVFDLNTRARAQKLALEITNQTPPGFIKVSRVHTMSVFVSFDSAIISQDIAIRTLIDLEMDLGNIEKMTLPSRVYHLPMIFDADECTRATARYMETQRPYARYLPDNIDFIRRNNGLKHRDEVLKAVKDVPFLVVASSGIMGLPILIQVDPRLRLTARRIPVRS